MARLRDRYDVIIVGAGTAGCALAARLSENSSRSVLLVEAGRHFGSIDRYPSGLRHSHSQALSLPGSPYSWPMVARLTSEITYPVPRGKVVGGSSAVNGALFVRGHPDDYDAWAAAGNTEWSYEKVLPAFIRQETDLDFGATDVHGARGPIPVKRADPDDLTAVSAAFVDACLARGFRWDPDMNGRTSGGVGLIPANSVSGIRWNAASCYVVPVLARTALTLLDCSLVRRVLFRGQHAIGIEAMRGRELLTLFADEVVLCAGSISSPQLLMLSGIGPADDLRHFDIKVIHDSPYVGKGLTDHPGAHVSYRADRYTPIIGDRPIAEVALNFAVDGGPEVIRLQPGIYTRLNLLMSARQGGSLTERLRAAGAASYPLRALGILTGTSLGALRADLAARSELMIACGLGAERSRGELRLRSADPGTPPDLDYRYMSHPEDLREMREALRTTCDLLGHVAFARLGVHRTDPTDRDLKSDALLNTWILRKLRTAFHTSSTARMGPSTDETAVVDQYCRVRGVEDLRVVDLSVLPALVRHGPSATAVMVGERASELFG